MVFVTVLLHVSTQMNICYCGFVQFCCVYVVFAVFCSPAVSLDSAFCYSFLSHTVPAFKFLLFHACFIFPFFCCLYLALVVVFCFNWLSIIIIMMLLLLLLLFLFLFCFFFLLLFFYSVFDNWWWMETARYYTLEIHLYILQNAYTYSTQN